MPKTATPRKPETVSRKLAETRAKSKNRSLSSLLGIGDNEKRLATDLGSGLNDVIGRGTIAGLLGLPGDLGGAAENGLRSLLGLPQVVPYGGSEHIGQKMEQAGLVSDVRRPKTELLASLISPAQAATAGYKAPQMARAGVKALDNLASAPTMARIGQRGAVETNLGKMVAPQDEALRVAQANAAKPVSEGGLGLRPDNTPEERAAAMGFDVNTPMYHGTRYQFNEFEPQYPRGAYGNPKGVYFDTDKSVAEEYSINGGEDAMDERSRIIEAYINPDGAKIKPRTFRGKDYAEAIVFDPKNIRSRFAAFDPMRRESSDIMAGLAPFGAVPWLRDEEP